jgi:hypothetical protein
VHYSRCLESANRTTPRSRDFVPAFALIFSFAVDAISCGPRAVEAGARAPAGRLPRAHRVAPQIKSWWTLTGNRTRVGWRRRRWPVQTKESAVENAGSISGVSVAASRLSSSPAHWLRSRAHRHRADTSLSNLASAHEEFGLCLGAPGAPCKEDPDLKLRAR